MPRHRPARPLLLLAAAIFAGASPAHAQIAFGSVGVEADDESGYIVFGALGGDVASSTTWDIAVSHADASTDFYDLSTTAYDGSIYHDFGSMGLRVGFGGWSDEEIVAVDQISAALDVHGETWSIALLTRLSDSDFEPLQINRTITRRDGSQVTIDGSADCQVDDLGLGARARVSHGEWTFSIDGMTFDYEDFACDFDLAVLDVLRRATRDEFVQLADRVTDALSLGSARHLLTRTTFLDSRYSLSLRRDTAVRTYGLYLDHAEDAFLGRVADTLRGSIGFVLRSGHEIEIYLGATDVDNGTVAFLGLSLLLLR
ncbi:MAG TPA: hypothetical protein VLD39_07865 [Gammaproteobacteria bacterium]|nr:hypothetical protein [Gammaproteobacteria bacterium]